MAVYSYTPRLALALGDLCPLPHPSSHQDLGVPTAPAPALDFAPDELCLGPSPLPWAGPCRAQGCEFGAR